MKTIAAIMRFIRLPLVWTAIGDSLAGAAIGIAATRGALAESDPSASLEGTLAALPEALASQWAMLLAVAIVSAALYLLGMGLNDLADLRDDRAAGRQRPLVQGQLPLGVATGTVVVLFGIALMAAAFLPLQAQFLALATLGCIAIYDLAAKRWPPSAVVSMSLCRMLNGLIGYAAIAGIGQPSSIAECVIWQAPAVAAAWLIGLGLVTAIASAISQWEKKSGRTTLGGRKVDFWIMNLLLGLSVVNAVAVSVAWQSAWGLLWLLPIALVRLTSMLMRRQADG